MMPNQSAKMKQNLALTFLMALTFVVPAVADELDATAALQKMVLRRDDAYRWEVRHRGEVGGCKYLQVHFVSQRWQDVDWKHTLFLILPPDVKQDISHALLLIDGGSWQQAWGEEGPGKLTLPRQAEMLAGIAQRLKSPVAIVRQVPFQPMLGDLREDALIAATLKKFFETDDKDWPLLPVMARSASAALDATTEVAEAEWQLKLKTFTATGGSKRGWTTYLVGAMDPRVTAIAPMVIDMLNLAPQMKHQLHAWGDYSRQIEDYTRLGLQQVLGTPKGDELLDLVDPYEHREKLTMPKLVILGTNDPYWPADAARFYYDDLPEPKAILNIPNNGHGLQDIPRLIGSLSAFHRSVIEKKPLPRWSWVTTNKENVTKLKASSSQRPSRVYAWTARSKTRDFRSSTWKASSIPVKDSESWTLSLEMPESGFVAGMIESQYDGDGPFPLSLTTMVYVSTDQDQR